MTSSLKPSAGIVAAGISAILGGILVSAATALAFSAMLRTDVGLAQQNLPPYAKMLSEIVWASFLLGAVYLIVCGVGVIRLRNWARVSLLIIAGMMLFFGLFGVVVVFFVILLSDVAGSAGTKAIIIGALAVVYGLPIGAGVWWLILFTRRAAIAQFQARTAELPPSKTWRFSKPGCPLPVSIVAWFLLSSVAGIFILPFLPFSLPLVFFGHLIQGPLATLLIVVISVLVAAASAGLLRLQRWSFPASVGLQLFYIASGVITLLNPDYVSQVKTLMNEMHLPPTPAGFPDFLQYTRYFGWFGLLIPIACAVTLFIARDSFYAAANKPAAAEGIA